MMYVKKQFTSSEAGTWEDWTATYGAFSFCEVEGYLYYAKATSSQATLVKVDPSDMSETVVSTSTINNNADAYNMVYDGNDVIYLNDCSAGDEFTAYTISTDTWTSLTASSSNLIKNHAVYHNGKIYYTRYSVGVAYPTIYTISTDSWSDGTGLSTTDVYGWAFDGTDSIYAMKYNEFTVVKYSISGDEWTSVVDYANNHVPAFVYNNILYMGNDSVYATTLYYYDLADETTGETDAVLSTSFTPRGCVVVDKKMYAKYWNSYAGSTDIKIYTIDDIIEYEWKRIN